MKKIAPLLILLITLIGCTKDQDALIVQNDDEQIVKINDSNTDDSTDEAATPPIEETPSCSDDLTKPVIFRVINELNVPVENVMVHGLQFGDLQPNETSCYLSTQKVEIYQMTEFAVFAQIDNKTYYSSTCYFVCGSPFPPIYEYTAGKFTMRIVSYDKSDSYYPCLDVERVSEEEPVFTVK